jgi:ABC-type bacteriocin/lantibiotic exporter with double-glycine peptidase domain
MELAGLSMSADKVPLLHLPVIAHWGGNHFVVIGEFAEPRVVILDPARGRLGLRIDAFALMFRGAVLCPYRVFGQILSVWKPNDGITCSNL